MGEEGVMHIVFLDFIKTFDTVPYLIKSVEIQTGWAESEVDWELSKQLEQESRSAVQSVVAGQ